MKNDTLVGSMEEARNLFALVDLFADFLGLQINRAILSFVGFGLFQDEEIQWLEA